MWELELENQLNDVLVQAGVKRENNDRRIWCLQNWGTFFTKSFIEAVFKLQVDDQELFKHAAKVWCKIAPPKVELLVWFVVLGKLNTKDRLASLNIIDGAETMCVLCTEQEECIEHLIFSSKYAWQLWCFCLNIWKVDWVMHADRRSAFESWIDIKLSKS